MENLGQDSSPDVEWPSVRYPVSAMCFPLTGGLVSYRTHAVQWINLSFGCPSVWYPTLLSYQRARRFIEVFVEGRAGAAGSSASLGTGSSAPRRSTWGRTCCPWAREALSPRLGAAARSDRGHASDLALCDGYGGRCCGSPGCGGSAMDGSVSQAAVGSSEFRGGW